MSKIEAAIKHMRWKAIFCNKNDKSNHPPYIIKQLPISTECRLSNLSSSKEIFAQSAKIYQEALIKCGYEHQLVYTPNSAEKRPTKKNPAENGK